MGAIRPTVALAVLLLGGAVSRGEAAAQRRPEPCPSLAALPRQIRTTNCDLAAAVAVGMQRSATFRRLVATIGDLHGVVYLTARPFVDVGTNRVFEGSVRHVVTMAGPYRFVYAALVPESGARPVITIAHELQHAIEILESGATTERAIDELFERIGTRTGVLTTETAAAVLAQRSVTRELSSR